MEGIAKYFQFQKHGTSFAQETRGGLTTFLAMVYILAVNPSILSATGMSADAIFVATALSAGIATIYAGLRAKLPIALASGMGLNAYFAYTVCIGMGYSWQMCLTAVLFEGIIFFILSKVGVREKIFKSIPSDLRKAISMGIGLFIAFIGFINAKIIVQDPATTVAHFNFKSTANFNEVGITVLLAIIGIVLVFVLIAKEVRGGILIAIAVTWLLGIICQLIGLYTPNPEIGAYSLIPSGIVSVSNLGAIKETLFAFDFGFFADPAFYFVTFAFLFVDLFDTLGTLTGCAIEGNMLDKDGNIEHMNEALETDSLGTILGSCLGTSTVTTFVESTAGIADGAKTGFASVVTGLLFILSLLFSPVFLAVPSFATAPALVGVGMMMIRGSAHEVNWRDFTEAAPAFMAMVMMPFAYSIATGIAYGFVFYTAIKLLVGRYTLQKDVSMVNGVKVIKTAKMNSRDCLNAGLIILSILFIVKFAIFGN